MLWNQAVHTDTEVTANRPDIIIRKVKACIFTDVTISADSNVTQIETKEFTYRHTTNVEHKRYEHTGNKWSHRNCNKNFKEKFGSHARKTFNTFTTTDCSMTLGA